MSVLGRTWTDDSATLEQLAARRREGVHLISPRYRSMLPSGGPGPDSHRIAIRPQLVRLQRHALVQSEWRRRSANGDNDPVQLVGGRLRQLDACLNTWCRLKPTPVLLCFAASLTNVGV